MLRHATHFACGLLAVLLIGCATTTGPSVSLVNLQFSGATAFETSAVFTIRLQNETDKPIRLKGAVHRVTLNGLKVGDAVNNEALEVPPLSSVTQQVQVHFSNLRLATRFKALIEAQSFDYVLDSTLYSEGGFGGVRVRNEGRLDLKQFQPSGGLTR